MPMAGVWGRRGGAAMGFGAEYAGTDGREIAVDADVAGMDRGGGEAWAGSCCGSGAAVSLESSIHPEVACHVLQECSFVLCPALKFEVRVPLSCT